MLDTIAPRLREVTVRPTVGAGERSRWDALMGARHYLPFRGLVGRSVRHVAVPGEQWLALVGWHAGAFKLKARDRWIGWLPEQQFRRLHLIANNARFLILPWCQTANLAWGMNSNLPWMRTIEMARLFRHARLRGRWPVRARHRSS